MKIRVDPGGSPHSQIMIRPSVSPTIYDTVFQIMVAMYGVRTEPTSEKCVKIVSSFICLVTVLLIPFSGAYFVHWKLNSLGSAALSLSELTGTSSLVLLGALSLSSMFSMIRRHEKIERLIRKSGRSSKDVLSFVIILVPCFIREAAAGFEHGTILFSLIVISFISLEVSATICMMIYYDTVKNLLNDLRLLDVALERPPRDLRELMSDKWRNRDRIGALNAIFATPLCLGYAQIFLSTIFTLAFSIGNTTDLREMFLRVSGYLCYVFLYFLLAREASCIKTQCLETHSKLLRCSITDSPLAHSAADAERHFRFDQDLDSLRIGCFDQSVSNYMRFLSVVTTCVAVVLQFDYKVVRTINKLSGQMAGDH